MSFVAGLGWTVNIDALITHQIRLGAWPYSSRVLYVLTVMRLLKPLSARAAVIRGRVTRTAYAYGAAVKATRISACVARGRCVTDIPGLNAVGVDRMFRATAMTCNAFRSSDNGNALPHTTGESVRCINCDDPQWKHWLRQALIGAEHWKSEAEHLNRVLALLRGEK